MKAQVSLKTGKNTKAIAKALIVEAKAGLPKVKVDVLPTGEKLKIDLEAEDFISLRAALNSFLGWAYCAEGVINNE
ncbi:MAG TPA: KEOPS complex subunit Pcc1 [Candidatus Poseidoniia archaeon]|jgi:tRNA threonylcarbamoyladenosine modification (KEOPS) complex  Pcc1 subunit|nr:KEOPS complex subunit Pcc1 [Candidatus Poseidoniia archaeon]|tara:strand:+ start:7209 stop:7436 length:228 start_codon:yes stop_codon:yes gene_type:complete